MELHFAIGQLADQPAVLADVADQHDIGIDLCHRARTDRLAEQPREAHLIVVAQRLIAKYQHLVLQPGRPERGRHCGRDLTREVDADDLGADVGRETPHLERRPCCCLSPIGRRVRRHFATPIRSLRGCRSKLTGRPPSSKCRRSLLGSRHVEYRCGRLALSLITRLVAGLSAALLATPAAAQTVADFYKGRQIALIIYSGPGSAYDVYGRLLARHMGKHIPGNPSFISQNMMGAGGLKALEYILRIAPKDGTVIGSIGRGIPFEPILGKNEINFDPAHIYWLGSMNRDTSLTISWKTAKVKTFEDLTKHELLVPGTGAGADSEIIPIALNNLAGTKYKIIAGYPNTTNAALAMERGELDGIAYWSWSALLTVKPDWVPTKQVNVLFHTGLKPNPDLPGVPSIRDLVKNEIDKKALEFILARELVGRPFIAGPQLPPERALALRNAFAATLKDAEFLAEAKRGKVDIDLVTGEEAEAVMKAATNAPKEVIDRVKQALERK